MGETLDVNTDWLAASSAAYERIFRIDPEILVVVGGLCWILIFVQWPGMLVQNKLSLIESWYILHIYTYFLSGGLLETI